MFFTIMKRTDIYILTFGLGVADGRCGRWSYTHKKPVVAYRD